MQGLGAWLGTTLQVVAVVAVAATLTADGRSVQLHVGERVVLRPGPDGRLQLVSAEPVDPALALPPKPGIKPDDSPVAEAPPGTIAVILGGAGPGRAALKVENGLDQAVDYHAALVRRAGEDPQPVAVCTVLPLLPSYESWPYSIQAAVVGGFHTRATNEVVCPKPLQPEK